MKSSLPNDIYSNLLQIPLFIGCTLVLPAIKRYFMVDLRRKPVWRYDVLRYMICNVIALTFILMIAIVFQGNDRLNFCTLVATDLSFGISIDILVHRAMRVGGCEIGNYGDPASYTRFMWHTAVCMCIMITTRCTSAIAAVFTFPFVNSKFEGMDQDWLNDNLIAYMVPAFYFIIRTFMLDTYNRYTEGYVRVVHKTDINDREFGLEDDDDNQETTSSTE